MKETVVVALSKGKLLDPTIRLFQKAGYAVPDLSPDPRRLVFKVVQFKKSILL